MQPKSFTLADLAKLTQSRLVGNSELVITNVADLESARQEDASFLANSRYEKAMQKSQAGVIFVNPQTTLHKDKNFLITDNPSLAFQKVVEVFYDSSLDESGFIGIHPTAVIHASAKIGHNVIIGPYVVIDKQVIIKDNTVIHAHCAISPGVEIGENCLLHANVVLRERSVLGNRVILQPGVVIGSCGFGYILDHQGRHKKLNQIGYVLIEDDVEIGANTTIDRARFKTTRISRGSKIDNLVQIAHGVCIGQDNIIIAQTGIAGSTETGKYVIIAGQVAVNGHIKLADGVMVSAKSGVSKPLTEAGGKYGGIPARPIKEYNRTHVHLRNIETYVNEIKNLQERLAALENQVHDSIKQ
jgi:UDP-3-O-[3-hydroxymyristoyl] glucosamine N-acyltransferase